MDMRSTERELLEGLRALQDPLDQYTFLIECGALCSEYPDSMRTERYLIKECQVRTWLAVDIEHGRSNVRGDSESLVVRGAIYFLEELFDARSSVEVNAYTCHLFDDENFTRHFSRMQLIGLKAAVRKLTDWLEEP